MFERFTEKARLVVVGAQEEARKRGADGIRTEHLLASVYQVPESIGRIVLENCGVTAEFVEAELARQATPPATPTQAEALATLGIDLDEVRRQVEDAFGPGALDRTRAARQGKEKKGWFAGGHLPFDRAAKKAMELSLREAIRLEHNYIGVEHIVLGLMHTETGLAHHILTAKGLTLETMRVIVEELVRGRRAG